MATTSESIVETLRELTEFVNDGREGYERAANESKHSSHQSYYRKVASQHSGFADELNGLLRNYGGEPERDTTL